MKIMVIVLFLLVLPICFAKEVNIIETFESEKNIGETTYYYAGSKLIATKNNDNINFQYQDRLGSEVESNSLPFGEEVNSNERFSFTGKELDEELYYFNARYYDSKIGRFTSVDPVPTEPAYQYVGNNPINLVDPSGMVPEMDSRFLVYNGPYAAREDWKTPMAMDDSNDPSYSGYVHDIPTKMGQVVQYVDEITGRFGPGKVLKENFRIIEGKNGEHIPFCSEFECADVATYMWALFQREFFGENDVVLPTPNGNIRYSEWGKLSREFHYPNTWQGYLRYVFVNLGTEALKSHELVSEVTLENLRPGDLIFTEGHVRTVKEIKYVDGNNVYTVFDGGSPARTIKVYNMYENRLKSLLQKDAVEFRRWSTPNSDQ